MAFEGNTWYTYLLYSLIAIFAFFGNALVLYILITRSDYLKRSYNIFIFSLATTDIIASIMLVFSLYLYLPPIPDGEGSKEAYCKIIWSAWTLFTLGYISIYTCLALTIERWLAVLKPHIYTAVRPRHAIKAVALVWIVGIAVNVSTIFRVKYNKTKEQCSWTFLKVGNEELPWLDFTLQSIIPFSFMIILYSHIIYTLKRLPFKAIGRRHPVRKTTMVALAASSAMIIGWLPSRVSFMLSKFGYVDPNGVFHYCLVMLSLSNSCVNPFIYNVYNRQFRNDCKEVVRNLFSLCTNSTKQQTSTSQSTEKDINGNKNAIFRLANVPASSGKFNH